MMSKASHTQGEWYTDRDAYSGRQTRVRASAKGGRDQVCVADCAQGGGSFDVLEANARLIAAAPEVLEALAKALPFIGLASTRQQIIAGVDAADLYSEIEAAIAKATGEVA